MMLTICGNKSILSDPFENVPLNFLTKLKNQIQLIIRSPLFLLQI